MDFLANVHQIAYSRAIKYVFLDKLSLQTIIKDVLIHNVKCVHSQNMLQIKIKQCACHAKIHLSHYHQEELVNVQMMFHIFKKLHQDLFVVLVQVHYTGEVQPVYQHIIAKDVQVSAKFTILNNNKFLLHSLVLVMLLKVFCLREIFV